LDIAHIGKTDTQNKAELLKLEGIGKEFFGNVVLSDINFSLKSGEIVGVVGENGAGKSTLMNILFGMSIIRSTGGFSGKFYINGAEAKFRNPFDALNAGVGMVHQEFSLIPGFSAAENIVLNRESMDYNRLVELFGPRFHTLNRGRITARAKSAIDKLGVSILPDTHVSDMPVGHKQFIEIAREIDRENTKILVFDEPTAVLAESEADVLMRAIKRLSDSGIGILFISHRLKEICDLCDRVIVLCDGKIVHESPIHKTNVREITEKMVSREVRNYTETPRRLRKPTGEVILDVRNLFVDMPGEYACDISFSVERGEIFGIGGLAGQGKLAIANGIMGLHYADGHVEMDGMELPLNNTKAVLTRGASFVSEERRSVGLLLEESIDKNITFNAMTTNFDFTKKILGGFIRLQDKAAMRECAGEYIKSLDIKCLGPSQRVVELSGGNQQKVCLAKAFASNPRLLFVSEPTRGIDVGAKQLVLDTLRMYNETKGVTVIMISSELEELRSICHRIAIVNEGYISGILPAGAPTREFGMLMTELR
jgi:simple sugar transport system ATP-binding protein